MCKHIIDDWSMEIEKLYFQTSFPSTILMLFVLYVISTLGL